MRKTSDLIFSGMSRAIFLVAFSAVLFALVAEYGFHKIPCALCIYQRYALLAVALAFAFKPLFCLRWPVLLASTGLCFYQLGIEQSWFPDILHTCTVAIQPLADKEAFRAQFMRDIVPSCDQVNFRIFGISAVLWTFFLHIFLNLIFGASHVTSKIAKTH